MTLQKKSEMKDCGVKIEASDRQKEVSKFYVIDKVLWPFHTQSVIHRWLGIYTLPLSHTHIHIYTGRETQKPCNWISCRKQTFSCKHIICHLYSLIHILYGKWRNTRACTHPCSLSNKQMRPESLWKSSPWPSPLHHHVSLLHYTATRSGLKSISWPC